MSQPRQPIESGVPDHMPYLHPLMKKNYGQWKWHERPRPGVLRHVAESGDEIWTVRAGTQRQMDVFTIRKLCDIADEFAEGFVRFTIRSNIEYMVSEQSKVQPLIDALTAAVEAGITAEAATLCLECPAEAELDAILPANLEIDRNLQGGASRVVILHRKPT